MLRLNPRNTTALLSLAISLTALVAACPAHDPPAPPDPCAGSSHEIGDFGYPACDRADVSRFYNPMTDPPSFDSVCWHGVTTTSGGNPSVVYPAFSGFNTLNANLLWGPQPGDYPPRKLELAESSSPLISTDAPSRRGPWPTLERPTIADTVDLITGQPLLQETDLELPFGSAVFRHTRTYSGIGPHAFHDWQDFSQTWDNHAPNPDPTEAFWDWNGHAWMMGEAPLFLMDARYWGWSSSPELPRCYFVPDAHHAIPFNFDENNSAYVAPQWIDARLDYAGGNWNADENRWNSPPTEYYVYLHAGAIKYTIKPLYRQDVAYDQCNTDGTTGFDLHNPPAPDRTNYNSEWSVGGESRQPGLGIPYLGLVTSIEDRNGNRIEIEYCDHQQEVFHQRECESDPPERDEWVQHGAQKGQIRRLRLFSAASSQAQWTLLYVYRTFRGDFSPWDPENLIDPDELSAKPYASRQRALDSIYVYEGEVATPTVDNQTAHSLTIPMTAFEAAYRAVAFGESLNPTDGLADAMVLTRDEVIAALQAAMNLDVAEGSSTLPTGLGWAVPSHWSHRVKYLYTEPSLTQYGPDDVPVYNERNFFGSFQPEDGVNNESAFYNMIQVNSDGAMTAYPPTLIASRSDTRVVVTTGANTTNTVTTSRHWLANYEMANQGVSEEVFTRSPVIKSVWSDATLALLGKAIDEATTASDHAQFARQHWPLGLLLAPELAEFPRVGDPESDDKLTLHQTADFTLRDWFARDGVLGGVGTPDGKDDDFDDDDDDFWKEAAGCVATGSGGEQLRIDAGVGVFTDRRNGALTPRTYKVRKFIMMPGDREFSVSESPGYLSASPSGQVYGTAEVQGADLLLRNSIYHAPYVFYGAAGMLGAQPSDPSAIPFHDQNQKGNFIPDFGEPLWATIIDEYDDESNARSSIEHSIEAITGESQYHDLIDTLPITRRVVWMNAAGFVLKEQVWDVRTGELDSDQGFITKTDLDSFGRVVARYSPGWGAPGNPDPTQLGRIDVYEYDTESREPSLVGIKQGTGGTVYYTAQVFRNGARSDLINATVQFTTPTTTKLTALPDLDNLPPGIVATLTEYELGQPLWQPQSGSPPKPIPNSSPIYRKVSFGVAAAAEPGGTPRRALAAEIYNYANNNDTPLVTGQPRGALLWKAYGQVASPTGAAPGDEVFWDYTYYDDRGRIIAQVVDAASGATFGDTVHDFAEVTVPTYPLSQFSRQPAVNDTLKPALMLTTLQWHTDHGVVMTKFPDGRFELTSYQTEGDTAEVRKGLFVFEGGLWRPVTSGDIQKYGGGAAEGGSIVTWPSDFQYFDGAAPVSTIADVHIDNDAAGRPTNVSLSTSDAAGVTGKVEYDWFGLASRETAFDGTRTRKVTNLRGQLEMVWRGTKDKHELWGNLNGGTPDDNMLLLEKNTYGTGVNDALKLVGVRRYRHALTPGMAFSALGFAFFDGSGWLETHGYDWRGRDVLVHRYRETTETNTNPAIITTTATHLDHLDRPVLVAEYDGDLPSGAPNPTLIDDNDTPPTAAQVVASSGGTLISLSETIYDARGKVLATRTYDPADVSKYTESTTYTDARGNATWSRSPNAPVTIRTYDSQGREIRSTQLVGTREIERTDTQRDTVGNAIRVITRERVTGATGDTLDESNAVRSYRFYWYDKSSRVIATLDAGTMNAANTHVDHGGNDRARPDAPDGDPRTMDDADGSGPAWPEVVGLNTTWFGGLTGSDHASKDLWAFELTSYDAKGNKTRDIVCNKPGVSGDDRITDTRYDGFGQVVAKIERTSAHNSTPPRTTYSKYENGKVVAMGTNPDEDSADWINSSFGGFQKTEITYGADIVVSADADILGPVSRNNGYIATIEFPSDEDTPTTSIAFTYYPDGLIASRAVRRGTASEGNPTPIVEFRYFYDELSRLTQIKAVYPETLPPPGGRPVDRVSRVTYEYDAAGRITTATAYTPDQGNDGNDDIVAQNVFAYDPMGRLLSEKQQHAGAVTASSPLVSYAWEQSTAKNTERLTQIVYPARVSPTGGPTTRTIEFGFDAADSIADVLSRPSTVSDASDINNKQQLAAYVYSGVSRRVGASWGHGNSGVPAASYSTIATSGVGHSGLDALGRLAGFTVKNSAGSSTPLFEAWYAYSPAGDLITRRVKQAAIGGLGSGGPSPDNTRSALLGYDRLGRLIDHQAGTLGVDANGDPEITSLWRHSAWSMDTLGNLKGTPAGGSNPAAPGLLVETDRDGDNVLDTLATTHDTARNNRLDGVTRADSITTVIDVLEVVNDRAGNVVCDDLYYYQYDAWNRLIQVRHKGTLEFDADGNAVAGTPGEWIVHYTYDALGRLIRRQLPHNLELEQVRIEEFYYDGVRRVSETLTTPLQSTGGGPIGGGGGGSSGQTQTFTDREYVWAPPPSGYVDECIAQIDRNNAVRYVIQDASYDVVALVAPQTQSVASKVIGQYTWDPYGQVLTAEYSGLASTYNKLGHHGLFADRLDANYQSATLAAGFMSSTHLPARIIYQVRNRAYDPSTQRWLQRDPNATGQVVLGSLASGGQIMSGAVSAIELTTLYGDGMSLYGYVGNGPVLANDPLGLEYTLAGVNQAMGVQALLGALINGGISGVMNRSWAAAGRGAMTGFVAGGMGGGVGYGFTSAYGHAMGAFANGATFGGVAGYMESGDWRVAMANAVAGAALSWAVDGLMASFFTSAFASEGATITLRPYREGGGHHIPAQSVLRGAENYNPGSALAIPAEVMEKLGIDHIGIVTPTQMSLYREFGKCGKPLTWDVVEEIETRALTAGRIDPTTARATVQKAIRKLIAGGVQNPTRIPFSRR